MSSVWTISLLALAAAAAIAFGSISLHASDEPGWTAMRALVRGRFPEVTQISPRDLADWMQDTTRTPPQILDVREELEFEVSHLPGAVRVSPEAAASDILGKLDPERPVVVYCSVGYRSSRLASRLIAAERRDVFNLEGSIFSWANEDRPLVTAEGKSTKLVHPFDFRYGKLLEPEHRAP